MPNQKLFKELFEKYTTGDISESERELFFQMIQSNPDDSYMGMLMDDLYEKIKSQEIVDLPVVETAFVEKRKGKVRQILYKAAAAAVISGVIILTALSYFNKKEDYKISLAENIHQTTRAQRDFILLPDSTQVWMNAVSDIRFPKEFAQDKREVYIEGEAFLDVKHADKIPFIIHLPGNIHVTVLGTSFNIKAFPDRDQAIISVKRGSVKVSRGDKDLSVLTAGQELRLNKDNNNISVKTVAIANISSWQQGNLYFNDMILKDVLKDIAQQKNIQIKIDNDKLGNTIISTGFKPDETGEDMLKIIQALTDCSIRLQDGVYILY